jgi:hypothetical protein
LSRRLSQVSIIKPSLNQVSRNSTVAGSAAAPRWAEWKPHESRKSSLQIPEDSPIAVGDAKVFYACINTVETSANARSVVLHCPNRLRNAVMLPLLPIERSTPNLSISQPTLLYAQPTSFLRRPCKTRARHDRRGNLRRYQFTVGLLPAPLSLKSPPNPPPTLLSKAGGSLLCAAERSPQGGACSEPLPWPLAPSCCCGGGAPDTLPQLEPPGPALPLPLPLPA